MGVGKEATLWESMAYRVPAGLEFRTPTVHLCMYVSRGTVQEEGIDSHISVNDGPSLLGRMYYLIQ